MDDLLTRLREEASRQRHMADYYHLVAQRDRLQMTLMRLVGVSTRTELEEMEALLRSLPGIDDDRSAALDAIHALLAYPLPPKEPR